MLECRGRKRSAREARGAKRATVLIQARDMTGCSARRSSLPEVLWWWCARGRGET